HHALSLRIENADVVHRRAMSQFRAAQEPAHGDGEVLWNILMSEVQLTKRVDRVRRVLRRGALQPVHRKLAVNVHSQAVAIDLAKLELSFGLAGLRRLGEPLQSGNMVG